MRSIYKLPLRFRSLFQKRRVEQELTDHEGHEDALRAAFHSCLVCWLCFWPAWVPTLSWPMPSAREPTRSASAWRSAPAEATCLGSCDARLLSLALATVRQGTGEGTRRVR